MALEHAERVEDRRERAIRAAGFDLDQEIGEPLEVGERALAQQDARHQSALTTRALGACPGRPRRAGVPVPLTARLVALIHDIERGERPQALETLDLLAATLTGTTPS